MKIINLTLIALILLSGCRNNEQESDAYGNFEAKEIIVSAEANGKILKLYINSGELLKEGQKIGLIDTMQLSLKLSQIVAQKNAIQTKFENIVSQVNVLEEQKKVFLTEKRRLEKLVKDKAAPKQKLDKIDGEIRIINSRIKSVNTQRNSISKEIEVLQKQKEIVKFQLEKCKMINPVKGTILTKFVEQGEMAGIGRPLYKIADISEMFLRVYISGNQLPNIKIGQKVDVFIDKSKKENQKLSGKISWISSQAEFTPKIIQTKEERVDLVYAVKIIVKNDGRLKIGMPGEIDFE
ncbi:MAG: HlyD family efflux transporter periplasmic adaptor subunit [Bacteroidota bacterium]|nr:HlyD family efflux transporter periplasmic adaptor subunit [Bacteroidota bacterium]